jgi:hypothetical protein
MANSLLPSTNEKNLLGTGEGSEQVLEGGNRPLYFNNFSVGLSE